MSTNLKYLTLMVEGPQKRVWDIPAEVLAARIDRHAGSLHFPTPTTVDNLLERATYLDIANILATGGHPMNALEPEDILAWGDRATLTCLPSGWAFRLEEVRTPEATSDKASPTPDDGWGHTSKHASTEELLREGAAAEKGTDKHEQVIRELLGSDNEKAAIMLLLKRVDDLQNELTRIRDVQENAIRPFMEDMHECHLKVRMRRAAEEHVVAANRRRVERILRDGGGDLIIALGERLDTL